MVNKIGLLDPEKSMYNLWSKVRWFIALVMFAIGILRIGQVGQSYPLIFFIAVFIGINLLNILFHLQIIIASNLSKYIQVFLDIVFATLVVHLTGGIESSFVWIYLVAVITASVVVEKSGGFVAAMVGVVCLLLLVIMYNVGWWLPVDGSTFQADTPSQVIFIISYTGLFTGVAFITSFTSRILRRTALKSSDVRSTIEQQKEQLLEKRKIILNQNNQIEKHKEVVDIAASIAGIDHEINNYLTVFSLSLRRLEKAGEEYKDEELSKTSRQMADSVKGIKDILLKFQDLKQLDLIKEKREKAIRMVL